jgi:hypothetical protein
MDSLTECWEPIRDYEGIYEVSNCGRVRSLDRKVQYRDEVRKKSGRVLKENTINGGYKQVTLQKDGKRKSVLVHRLVAEMFIENFSGLPQVNHKDGDKTNNSVENLEWCSAKENMIHSVKNRIRTDCKLVEQISLEGKLLTTFDSLHEAERKTGVHRQRISDCCKAKLKSAGGYIWRYQNEGVRR